MFSNPGLRRFLICTTLVLAAASETGPVETNTPPARPAEAAVIAACGGRVLRLGETLHFTTAKGSSVELQDKVNEDTGDFVYNKYELSDCADDLGLFVVSVGHYESTTQILIDQTFGSRFEVAGPIHVSPSKRAFVVVESFGSGGENWNFGIDVFHRLPNGGWNETWQYRPQDFQGSEFVAWEGEDAVRISTATWKETRVTGHETVLHVSPTQFVREDGPETILSDEKGRYVDHIPGEQ